jgi:hypothetical protein
MISTWLSSADRALSFASSRIKVIRAVTAKNARSELALVAESIRRGAPRLPRWEYDSAPVSVELCRGLERLAEFLDAFSPLGRVYAARARELCTEAAIVDAVGTPQIRTPAARRFLGSTPQDGADLDEADRLADAWSDPTAAEPDPGDELVRTCDEDDPRSLVSALSREVGRARLPIRVVVDPDLASMAATGDGVILVAAHQWVRPRDVERTVLHEIAAHALPRIRAASAKLGIFAFGTARGTDDQEGRALLIERAAGFLDARRRRELGLRHLAARATLDGASFLDVVHSLRERRASLADAVRIAGRVQRGGSGSGGLGREVIYIAGMLRVERALSGRGAAVVEEAMAAGRVAADVAPILLSSLADDTPRGFVRATASGGPEQPNG